MTKTLEQAKIDQGISEGVEIGNGVAIPKVRTFNAKSDSLAINAFGGRALSIYRFGLALTIQRITQTRADASWHGNGATALAGAFVVNRTRLFDEFVLDVFGKERTDVLAAFVFDDSDSAVGVGEEKRHG